MFEGFRRDMIDTGEVQINCAIGGSGPPLLLLHGYPQSLVQWAKVGPLLVEDFTVVCADLRGYGDSEKPHAEPDFSNYSFRSMARDQVALMAKFGFDRFHVAGHDRGGRVAHRMALDWPANVQSLTVMDIVPTWTMYDEVSRELAMTYWQWYFLPQPEPYPEQLIGNDPDYYFERCIVSNGGEGLDMYDAEMVAEYRRCWNDPEMIHASCSDYRAGAGIDLEHDRHDLATVLPQPVLALWAGHGMLRTRFDIEEAWRPRCQELRSVSIPGGHFFPELQPVETAAALRSFLAP